LSLGILYFAEPSILKPSEVLQLQNQSRHGSCHPSRTQTVKNSENL